MDDGKHMYGETQYILIENQKGSDGLRLFISLYSSGGKEYPINDYLMKNEEDSLSVMVADDFLLINKNDKNNMQFL